MAEKAWIDTPVGSKQPHHPNQEHEKEWIWYRADYGPVLHPERYPSACHVHPRHVLPIDVYDRLITFTAGLTKRDGFCVYSAELEALEYARRAFAIVCPGPAPAPAPTPVPIPSPPQKTIGDLLFKINTAVAVFQRRAARGELLFVAGPGPLADGYANGQPVTILDVEATDRGFLIRLGLQ